MLGIRAFGASRAFLYDQVVKEEASSRIMWGPSRFCLWSDQTRSRCVYSVPEFRAWMVHLSFTG